MRASGLAQVIKSKHNNFKPGDILQGAFGWQSHVVFDGNIGDKSKSSKGKPTSELEFAGGVTKIPSNLPVPISAHLGALGGTGLTAYFGLLHVGKPEINLNANGKCTVLISGAAGATGSGVGQIAKIKGCRVVGLAGSKDKCDWLVNSLGFDAAINYKQPTKAVTQQIRAAAPNGVDIYFDNVGGELLDVALSLINKHARVVICGAISQYNAAPGDKNYGPVNYMSLLINSATMQGFVVFDYVQHYKQALAELSQWIISGKLKYSEDIVDGLENAPSALLRLFDGSNTGKLLLRVARTPLTEPQPPKSKL